MNLLSKMLIILLIIIVVPVGCKSGTGETQDAPISFEDYWYAGKAEITTYALSQSRYGESRVGKVVLVFVTEDFSISKQVKLDYPEKNKDDAIKVLKLNLIKRFPTGIYDYSVMQSIFTPIQLEQYPNSLKTTTSVQDWCGQTFTQINLDENAYKLRMNSYFESEGDIEYNLNKVFLEDEIWTRIRIDPGSLPFGEFEIIPGAVSSRFNHKELQVEMASANLEEVRGQKHLLKYSISYLESGRKLSITFNKNFLYEIISWEESFVKNGETYTTKAVKNKSINIDYWNKNENKDSYLRRELGITGD